jgi:hypothetical protein
MTYNGVRDDSPHLRDIQDLIARLDDVNKKIAHPTRTMLSSRPADAGAAEAVTPSGRQRS